MSRSWRICVEEFEGARQEIGVLGALAYVSGVVLSMLVAMVILLILGALALVLLPLALVVALAALCASRFAPAQSRGTKPPADPWLSG